jgi:hypothetical protein
MRFADGTSFNKWKTRRNEPSEPPAPPPQPWAPAKDTSIRVDRSLLPTLPMRELELVTRPAGSIPRALHKLTRSNNDTIVKTRIKNGKLVQKEKRVIPKSHPLDPVSHWAIKDGKDYHELVVRPDGKSEHRVSRWTKEEKAEILSKKNWTWTDRPKSELRTIG